MPTDSAGRNEASGLRPAHGGVPVDDEASLRLKYFDYCSAQVADLLLYLSPDEIFDLAERANREAGATSSPSYSEAVQVATRWIAKRLALPPFDVWRADYLAHPERYEAYLMGLWEMDAQPSAD